MEVLIEFLESVKHRPHPVESHLDIFFDLDLVFSPVTAEHESFVLGGLRPRPSPIIPHHNIVELQCSVTRHRIHTDLLLFALPDRAFSIAGVHHRELSDALEDDIHQFHVE